MIRQGFAPVPHDLAEWRHVVWVDLQLAQCMRHVVVAPATKSERHGVCNRLVLMPWPRPFRIFPFSPVFVVIGGGVDDRDLADTGLAVDGCSRRQNRCFVLRYPWRASSVLMHSLKKGDGLSDGRLREHECRADQMFDYDAEVIARLHTAGAVLVCKLAMVELAGGGADAGRAARRAGLGPSRRVRLNPLFRSS